MISEIKELFSDRKTVIFTLAGMFAGAFMGAAAYYNGWLG